MGVAYTLPKKAKCGQCKSSIKDGDIYTIIYEDDNSGKINHLLCDNCEVDDRIQEYRDTGIVSRLSLEAAMANYHYERGGNLDGLRKDVQHFYTKYKKDLLEIAIGNEEISEIITAFEVKHWLPYLKKYWNDTDQRGHEAKVGKIKVMMWGCAGRVLITAEQGEQNITMIFSDSESQVSPNGGQQGIHGSQKVVKSILQKLVDADKIKFKNSKTVTLAGL